MASSAKDRLLKGIGELPEEAIPKLYRILRALRIEHNQNDKRSSVRGSLKGIWKDSRVDETLFDEAKHSLFPLRELLGSIMDYVCDTHAIVWYFTEDPRLTELRIECI